MKISAIVPILFCATTAGGCDADPMSVIREVIETTKPGLRDTRRSGRTTVFEQAGHVRIQRGFTCARPDGLGALKISEKAEMPAQWQGTVIFNGWALRYLGTTDHHVQVLGSGMLVNVRREVGAGGSNELRWEALGDLADDIDRSYYVSAAEPYESCYWYALLFWRQSDILQVAAPDVEGQNIFFGEGSKVLDIVGALSTDPALGPPRTLVPRGQIFVYTNQDHHLLQVGYDMGTPFINGQDLEWNSRAIIKDDDAPASGAAEAVGVMAGDSVHFWQPPTVLRWWEAEQPPAWVEEPVSFALEARGSDGWGGAEIGGPTIMTTTREHFAVHVPFAYAVPMLTGWEVGNGTDDRHILRAGVYLEDFSFVQHASGKTGTVYYTVVTSFFDDDQEWVTLKGSHRVSILGLKHVAPGRHPDFPDPDLGPIKPTAP